MRVIIIGAGIGGTSAALALQKLGHDVVVYDQMRENKPVGAALSLWSNGVKVLNWLGLGDEVAALGGRMDDMAYYEGFGGAEMCRFSLETVTTQTGQRPYPVARADLQALLMERVGTDRVHLGRKLVAVSEADGIVTATGPARRRGRHAHRAHLLGLHELQRPGARRRAHRVGDPVDHLRRRRQALRGHAGGG